MQNSLQRAQKEFSDAQSSFFKCFAKTRYENAFELFEDALRHERCKNPKDNDTIAAIYQNQIECAKHCDILSDFEIARLYSKCADLQKNLEWYQIAKQKFIEQGKFDYAAKQVEQIIQLTKEQNEFTDFENLCLLFQECIDLYQNSDYPMFSRELEIRKEWLGRVFEMQKYDACIEQIQEVIRGCSKKHAFRWKLRDYRLYSICIHLLNDDAVSAKRNLNSWLNENQNFEHSYEHQIAEMLIEAYDQDNWEMIKNCENQYAAKFKVDPFLRKLTAQLWIFMRDYDREKRFMNENDYLI